MNLVHLFFLMWTSIYGEASLSESMHLCHHLEAEAKKMVKEPGSELFAENPSTERVISWSPSQKLNWKDFQGNPHPEYPHIAALTFSSIVYKYHCEDGFLNIDVVANFRINDSWVRPEAKKRILFRS